MITTNREDRDFHAIVQMQSWAPWELRTRRGSHRMSGVEVGVKGWGLSLYHNPALPWKVDPAWGGGREMVPEVRNHRGWGLWVQFCCCTLLPRPERKGSRRPSAGAEAGLSSGRLNSPGHPRAWDAMLWNREEAKKKQTHSQGFHDDHRRKCVQQDLVQKGKCYLLGVKLQGRALWMQQARGRHIFNTSHWSLSRKG